MKAKEFITEWSDTPDEITQILVKKGYQLLGSGIDQTAFLEPRSGKVLKIFGTQRGAGANKYTKDQKMFIFWADYCKKNSNNPFLPRFSGWETFDFQGNKYLQIRMERLIELPEADGDILSGLADDNESWQRARRKKERADSIGDDTYKHWNGTRKPSPTKTAHNELVLLLGQEHYDLLLSTLADLNKIANSKGWEYDLHSGNFMRRNDGTPVIVDPWTL